MPEVEMNEHGHNGDAEEEWALAEDMYGNECRMPPGLPVSWLTRARKRCASEMEVFRPLLAAGKDGARIGRLPAMKRWRRALGAGHYWAWIDPRLS